MKSLVLSVVTIALVGLPATAHADTVVLDGVQAAVTDDTGQVVTVNRTRGYHARVAFWERADTGWVQRVSVRDGRIGYGGLVRATLRRQGTGTTPLGTFRLPWAFGTHAPDDAWSLGYRKIRRGDYWVQDNSSAYYNRYRNKRQGGFRWWLPSSHADSSERLTDYGQQYEFAIVTGFNKQQVRHRGSGILLHVNGDGATAGCVSAPRRFLVRLMRALEPGQKPVIAVGR